MIRFTQVQNWFNLCLYNNLIFKLSENVNLLLVLSFLYFFL